MHYVYLIKSSKDGRVYVGSTSNLVARFSQHNKGEVRSTQFYRPLKLVYYEAYTDLKCARLREKEIKVSHSEKAKILKRINMALSSIG